MKFTGKECDALTAKGKADGVPFVLAKPQTYMNLSGQSVKKLVRKYCDDESELVVVYDDADLPVGRMRIREEGSAGTHNGMRSIVSELNTTEFKRLRIGIKRTNLRKRSSDYRFGIVKSRLCRQTADRQVHFGSSRGSARPDWRQRYSTYRRANQQKK